MLTTHKESAPQMEIVILEDLVPADHLLRKINAAIDFHKIYDFVENLYCHNNGRPGIDPVVLFKIVLIQHIFGIPSLRRTVEEINVNVAYRWFIGYGLTEQIPHFSTVSHNFKHRFTSDTVETVFQWILQTAAGKGYLDTEAIFVDGTHFKASASMKRKAKKRVPVEAKRYAQELFEEINRDREERGKPPLPPKDGEEREITVSTTDPDAGVFRKGDHKMCMAYEAHTACDKNNFILDVHVTAGNIHDSEAFDPLYDSILQKFPAHKFIVGDSAYKTPWICKRVSESGRIFSTAYTRPHTKKGFFPAREYVYDEYFDVVICPEGHALRYATTSRDGRRQYSSNPQRCLSCPSRAQCTHSKTGQKVVTRHLWQNWIDLAEEIRHSLEYGSIYSMRLHTIERVFADAKEKHGMRFTQHRGLTQVTKWVKLKFAAMNLKTLALRSWRAGLGGGFCRFFVGILRVGVGFVENREACCV